MNLTLHSRRTLLDGRFQPALVHIAGERIARVDRLFALDRAPAGAIDLGDLALAPGVIDVHVHVNEPGRTEWEGFASAGRAALAGGTTSIVVMPLNCTPAATTVAALLAEAKAAQAACMCDVGLWGGIVPGNAAELEPMLRAGALGFKCFMVHSGVDDFPGVSERELDEAYRTLAAMNRAGGDGQGPVVLAHAEDPTVIDAARAASGLDERPRDPRAWAASRPADAEVSAIRTLVDLCRRHRVRTHVVHVATSAARDVIAAAKRAGLPLTAETCPHYLHFNLDGIGEGQTQYKCAPPIRDARNASELMLMANDGLIDLIASDHSPCPPSMKSLDTGNFITAWGGISSLQLMPMAVWGHPALNDAAVLTRCLYEAPARLAGLSHRKGRIAPGMDADLAVIDPEGVWHIDQARLHHRHPLTPYHGVTLPAVHATVLRGSLVYRNPDVHASPTRTMPGNLDAQGFAKETLGTWLKPSPA